MQGSDPGVELLTGYLVAESVKAMLPEICIHNVLMIEPDT
jgi:hypothetical protein